MTTIIKKPYGTFEVQWYQGKKRRSKSFKTKREAREFSLQISKVSEDSTPLILFKTILEEYRDRETIKKRGVRAETLRINRFLKHPIANKTLANLTKSDLQNYIDERLASPSPTGGTIAPSTVIREITTICAVLSYARENGLMKEKITVGLNLPKPPEHRERVASETDQEAIIVASGWDGISPPINTTQLTALAFIFSCRTGMRSGEILGIEPSWIDGNVIHLPKEATKTASKRDIALNTDAKRLLELAIQAKQDNAPRIFSVLNERNRDVLFRKVRDRAGLGPVYDSNSNLIQEGLNFHDGRATFATWAASPDPKTGAPRLDVLALARQTGHKDLKMLQKYYRASAEEIAKRLE